MKFLEYKNSGELKREPTGHEVLTVGMDVDIELNLLGCGKVVDVSG